MIQTLVEKCYAFKTSSNANRLEQLANRAERGLISYDKRYHFPKPLRSHVISTNAFTARSPSSVSFVLREKSQFRREAEHWTWSPFWRPPTTMRDLKASPICPPSCAFGSTKSCSRTPTSHTGSLALPTSPTSPDPAVCCAKSHFRYSTTWCASPSRHTSHHM